VYGDVANDLASAIDDANDVAFSWDRGTADVSKHLIFVLTDAPAHGIRYWKDDEETTDLWLNTDMIDDEYGELSEKD
jgi:hypothetical protein